MLSSQQHNLREIPVIEKHFKDEDEAIQYAIHRQRDRRNMTEAELWKCIQWMDKRKERGGDHRSEEFKSKAQDCAIEKSVQQTAQTLGISPRKVEQARTVLDHGDQETKQAIEAGEMSINKAYEVTQAKRRQEKSEMKKNMLPKSRLEYQPPGGGWEWVV